MMNKEIVATGGNPENAISVYNYETKFKVAEVVHAHEARIRSFSFVPTEPHWPQWEEMKT